MGLQHWDVSLGLGYGLYYASSVSKEGLWCKEGNTGIVFFLYF